MKTGSVNVARYGITERNICEGARVDGVAQFLERGTPDPVWAKPGGTALS